MYREAIEKMALWKDDEERKPLILKGARQTGKTWLMKEFGRLYYNDIAYFNFDQDDSIAPIFQGTKDPSRIIDRLALLRGEKAIEPGKTLIIFDEIQECPEALNTLKYFKEEAPEYHVVAAGSLLGTLLAAPKSYPVGAVNILQIRPLTFAEFLREADTAAFRYYEAFKAGDENMEFFHRRLTELYAEYLIVGGMPECVSSWLRHKDPERVEEKQRELIELYENDIAKHSGSLNSGRILLVFRSIVSQLSKPNRKFQYTAMKPGARSREFESAVEWLVSAGVLTRVYNVSKPEHPLPAFDRLDAFKLYLFDTGLLKEMSRVENSAIILSSDYQFKGPLTENFVLQQLQGAFRAEPRYYADKNQEVDFLLQSGTDIIPVETKSGENINSPSLAWYVKKYSPKTAVRFSMLGYKKSGSLVNIPLYFAGKTGELI